MTCAIEIGLITPCRTHTQELLRSWKHSCEICSRLFLAQITISPRLRSISLKKEKRKGLLTEPALWLQLSTQEDVDGYHVTRNRESIKHFSEHVNIQFGLSEMKRDRVDPRLQKYLRTYWREATVGFGMTTCHLLLSQAHELNLFFHIFILNQSIRRLSHTSTWEVVREGRRVKLLKMSWVNGSLEMSCKILNHLEISFDFSMA